MYRYENWTIKKAQYQRINAFKLWCWRRLLRVPWTAERSNQSIQKEINPEYSLKGLCWSSNTLSTWWEEPTQWKRLMLGKTEGRSRGKWQRMRWLDNIPDWHEFEQPPGDTKQGAWHAAAHGVTKSWTRLSNWKTKYYLSIIKLF